MKSKSELEQINDACLSELKRHDMVQDDYDMLLLRVMREKLSRAVLGRVQDLTIEELLTIHKMNRKQPAQVSSVKKK